MKETLQKLAAHMLWADEQVLKRFRDAHAEVEVAHLAEAVRLYAHVLAVERVWYLRLLQQDWKVQKVWPMMAVESCAALAKENAAALTAYLDKLSEEDLAKPIPYVNSQGESFTNTAGDILLQIVLHGVHHRGQVATTLRRVGIEPPVLDYIRFVRGR
jgi:uncharacterized damage-inducible protein DinB